MCVLFFCFFFPYACPPVCLLTLWCARATLSGSSHRHAGCRSKSGKLQMDLIRSRGKSKRCDPKVPPPLQKKDLCHPESRALTDEVNVKVSEATEMNIKAHPLQNSNLYYKINKWLCSFSSQAVWLSECEQILQGIAFRWFIVKYGSKSAPHWWEKKIDLNNTSRYNPIWHLMKCDLFQLLLKVQDHSIKYSQTDVF